MRKVCDDLRWSYSTVYEEPISHEGLCTPFLPKQSISLDGPFKMPAFFRMLYNRFQQLNIRKKTKAFLSLTMLRPGTMKTESVRPLDAVCALAPSE